MSKPEGETRSTETGLTPPEKNALEQLIEFGEVGMTVFFSCLGPAGVLLSESSKKLVTVPYYRRQLEWQRTVAQQLMDLGVSVDQMKSERLHAATYAACVAAAKTVDEKKRSMLRNAISNVALDLDIEAEETDLFIRYVDEIAPSQMTLLHRLQGEGMILGDSFFRVANRVYGTENASIEQQRTLFSALRDFESKGLVNMPGLYDDYPSQQPTRIITEGSPEGSELTHVTDKGHRFIRFISDPRNDE